ncbi:hypothetical protein [Methanomethylophilus alvi]|uniref:hypothetical protein n=1 Tax=Methanomethylophilus alvi TaxID=1291540 RepID=UPI0037DD072B
MKAIIAVLAAAIIVGGVAGIVLMEDHDDSEKPTNYVETKTEKYSSVINYNSKATQTHIRKSIRFIRVHILTRWYSK